MLMFKNRMLWISHDSNITGANIAMIEFISALENEYDHFIVLPHHGNMQQYLNAKGLPNMVIHQYGWANKLSWWKILLNFKILFRSLIALYKLNKCISYFKPNIISTNTIVPFIGSICSKIKKIKHVWWVHEFGKEDFGFSIGWGFEKYAIFWMNYSSKLIICNSNATLNKFKIANQLYKIHKIYQPVSWNPLSEPYEKIADFIMFGQIISSKGHLEVLRVLAECKKKNKTLPTLHIKGPCNDLKYLNNLKIFIKENHLEKNVMIYDKHFTKEKELPKYKSLIMSSSCEAFGRVIIEAIKAGLYVIVKDIGGGRELVNETNGIVYANKAELENILTNSLPLMQKNINLNYDENNEIKKLKFLLHSI